MNELVLVDNNGVKMLNDIPDNFGSNFDWIVTANTIIKNKDIPKTIYIKTDFLPKFANHILPSLREEFILITSCSDYSPSVNFPREFNIIINHVYLKMWYTNNRLRLHPKLKAYPAGLCSYEDMRTENLLSYRKSDANIQKTSEKVLCIWNPRPGNICGDKYATRPAVRNWINEYPNIFEWVEPTLTGFEFFKLVSNYKYVLCPVGNGVDPCPKSFEAIILKALPIIIKTPNTIDVYDELPCILVNDFKEILEPGFLDANYEKHKNTLYSDDIMYKLSCEYWSKKIKSNFDTF